MTIADKLCCSYCRAEFVNPSPAPYRIAPPLPEHRLAGLAQIDVGNLSYDIMGRLGVGKFSQVFLARRASPLTELVIIKVAKTEPDDTALKREFKVLSLLRDKGDGKFISQHLPTPLVSHAVLSCDRPVAWVGRWATVYRWRCGLHFSLAQVKQSYPRGVSCKAAIWMWNRLLDQLHSLHKLRYWHGAIEDGHVLIHPQDHGLGLCGWTSCSSDDFNGASDLTQSGLLVASVLGSDTPKQILELTKAAGRFSDAHLLKEELARTALALFGPPKFEVFKMPPGQQ